MNIVTEYPIWFVFFCVLLGLAYAAFLYYRENRISEIAVWLRAVLAGFRFIVTTILAFLLLGPFIQTVEKTVEKPIIVIAEDSSSSIVLNKDSTSIKENLVNQLTELEKSLESDYDVVVYNFGKEVNSGFSNEFINHETDLSKLMEELNNRYSNRNLGAVVLATDGIFNVGANPIFNASELNAPIYTVAIGDTTVKKDLILKTVAHNRLAFLGNEFPIEVVVQADKLKGSKSTLNVYYDGGNIHSQTLDINDDSFLKTIPLKFEAGKIGIQKYSISLSTIRGEFSTINNRKTVYIDVLDSRQKILVLAAAPHPDIAAIRSIIETNDNYEVNVLLAQDFSGSLDRYDLVVLHQLPSNQQSVTDVLNTIATKNIPCFFVIGSQTRSTTINNLNIGVNITPGKGSNNETLAELNKSFALFTLPDQTLNAISKYPPLIVPFGKYELGNSAQCLFYQKIGNVPTQDPLLFFSNINDHKYGALIGEGIWKWRLFNFLEFQNHEIIDELILKSFQYLATKEDKSNFRINVPSKFLENENIRFSGELYNKSYELVSDPDVNLIITNEDGNEFSFSFDRLGNGYKLNAGRFGAGEYSWTANTTYNNERMSRSGKFSVEQVLTESANTTADHQLLYNLSERTGGKLFYPDNIASIGNEIKAKNDIVSVSYSRQKLSELINKKFIFFLLLTLLSVEWFIRKRQGAY